MIPSTNPNDGANFSTAIEARRRKSPKLEVSNVLRDKNSAAKVPQADTTQPHLNRFSSLLYPVSLPQPAKLMLEKYGLDTRCPVYDLSQKGHLHIAQKDRGTTKLGSLSWYEYF